MACVEGKSAFYGDSSVFAKAGSEKRKFTEGRGARMLASAMQGQETRQ